MIEHRKRGGMKAAYQIAYRKAGERIGAADLDELCRRSGAIRNGSRLRVSFFGERVQIRIASAEGEPEFEPEQLPLVEKILILHYLLGREHTSVKTTMVAFKNLPGASFYDPTYQKRGPKRIARRFGQNIEAFHGACGNLRWQADELGDASYHFDIFPKVKGLVVLHAEDEEFPAEANILFSGEIVNFLPLEDVAVLAGLIATRLARAITN